MKKLPLYFVRLTYTTSFLFFYGASEKRRLAFYACGFIHYTLKRQYISTIYCTFEFAGTMVQEEGWRGDDEKDQRWNNGYLANYKGHNVIVLPQSYEDETNSVKVIDPAYAWIIPTGTNKPVRVAFEGNTIVDEFKNYDRSREVQVYKKMGVAAIITNNICVYRNTSLAR